MTRQIDFNIDERLQHRTSIMPLFYVKYDILPEHRGNCTTFFAMMNDEMGK